MTNKHDVIKALSGLPYPGEMQDYLISLTAALTGKLKPPLDYINDLHDQKGIFVCENDLLQTIDALRGIFLRDGHLPPWALEDELIQMMHPRIPQQALDRANMYAQAELEADHLTHYLQKPQVPVVMGMAALYNQTTGNPVSCIEIDFSNMRGTNEHHAKILACAEGTDISPEIMAEAMNLTDQSALIVADSILRTIEETLKKNLPDGGFSVIPLRTGGDEVRIVLTDIDEQSARSLLPTIHECIERETAKLGQHDHQHSKRPLDPWSRGFGASATVFTLSPDGDLAEIIRKADHEISHEKIKIGKNRIDNPEYNQLKPTFSHDPHKLYTDPSAARQWLEDMMATMARLREPSDFNSDFDAYKSDIPSLEDAARACHHDHLMTLDQIHNHYLDCLRRDFQKSGLFLTPQEEKALAIKVRKFPAIDHASGTLMGGDLPAMAGAALATIDDISKKTGISAAPWVMGISFHNLAGLNDADKGLGHDNANCVLHYQANNILRPALEKAGIHRDHMTMAHMGGGEFRMIIQPVIIESDGRTRTIDAHAMDALSRDIQRRVRDLNATDISSILKLYKRPCPSRLVGVALEEIENPRAELRPHENGVTVTTVACQYKPDLTINTHEWRRGGALVSFIGQTLTETIAERREKYEDPQDRHRPDNPIKP